jgi:hypothetical protein
VLFTGPTGAGKTTVAQAWASSRSTPTAFFDHDDARFILKAGYVKRSEVAADPALRPEGDRQWLLAARVCEAMADEYVRSGVDFALAAFRPPGEWMGIWQRLDAMDPIVIVLLPSIETTLERDAGRSGRAHTGEGSIRRAFAYDWEPWRRHPRTHIIDNSALSVQDVVAVVEDVVARG